ncbi:hypothetical protein PMAYCL1PPCAC_07400 [Pristionchus mayeri]|uniref:Mediator of RNA polymerase II transcription subunit 8 n=1 Tax=Pristionchus mayeri TaxID=1317129 RepID=A0AAN5CAX0_9BILA|nr:hypothetical protein PMAYCL1PPCAC_07400 [Pristionchus mayeri]
MNNYPNPLHYQHEPERSAIENTMRQIEQRASGAKGMIEELLYLLDLQTKAPWPTMLEKMSSLGAEMAQLQAILHRTQQQGRDDSVQNLRTHLLVPQMLSMDMDPRLQEATQHRVHSFHHDLVPDYLRTKADTVHEQEEQQMEQGISNKDTAAIVKQTIGLNRNVDSLIQGQTNAERALNESVDNVPTFDASETARLAKAVCSGFGLERQRAPPPPPLQVQSGHAGLGGSQQMGGGGGGAAAAAAAPPMGMGMGSGMHMQQPGMMHGQPHSQQPGGYPVHQNGMGGMQGGVMGGAVPGGGPPQPGMMMNPMNPMMRRPM